MITDTVSTITKLINSPPAQLAAGGVLAGIVWKFFERVEAVLTDQTKLEIAVWILDRKTLGSSLHTWPDSFAKMFDRVFGQNHLSLRCFWRSTLASYVALALVACFTLWHGGGLKRLYQVEQEGLPQKTILIALVALLSSVLLDYVSLLKTRWLLFLMESRQSSLLRCLLLISDFCIDCLVGGVATFIAFNLFVNGSVIVDVFQHVPSAAKLGVMRYAQALFDFSDPVRTARAILHDSVSTLWFAPVFFTSIWLWLYAGSGFLLKAARRFAGFDRLFNWFTVKVDIEKKPLQSIGLVAGALVAVVYWAAAIVSRVVG